MVDKKKKKKEEDEFFKIMNDQLRKIFETQFPGMITPDFDANSEMFKKMFKDILKKMNIDPKVLENMDPNEIQKIFSQNKMGFQGPFVFGMNFGISPEGKPMMGSFGNIKPKMEGKTEIRNERDPLVDIYEENGHIIVICEVPGVDKDEIELKASTNELEIMAGSPVKGLRQRKYHKIISLPAEINPDVAKARYTNGILEVKLEKVDIKITKKKINID